MRVILPVGQVADAEKKRCYDCSHMEGYVSWWCRNKKAIKWRGTSIPGVSQCPFWAPAPTKVPLITKIEGLFSRKK